MKLLFDQNLSHRLIKRLADLYPESEHIRFVGLDRANDLSVWNYARGQGFYIVTQDEDYAELIRLRGAPPKVIWLRCGNARTSEIESILRQHFNAVSQLASSSDLFIVELFA